MAKEEKLDRWTRDVAAAAVRASDASKPLDVNDVIVRCAQDVTGGFTHAQQAARVAIKENALNASHIEAVAVELDSWNGEDQAELARRAAL